MKGIALFVAVLPERTKCVPRYLIASRAIVTMVADNPNFPALKPLLAEVSEDLDDLAESEELALRGGKGMVAQRDVVLCRVHNKMNVLRACVQSIANAEPERAEAIVLSAGMKVGKRPARTKLPLNAKRGNAVGRVVLDAKALPKPVQYHWQMSADQATWTDLPETFRTKTVVDGLVPHTFYSFRLRTVTNNGLSEWSSPVTVLVH